MVLTISDRALTLTKSFDALEIALSEINALVFADDTITVKADSGEYAFSGMGRWCEPFYGALKVAYNRALQRSLFVKDKPLFTARGAYRYVENQGCVEGKALFHVYENSVVSLTPDLFVRRIPLCFVNAIEKSVYELSLELDTGERYTYSELGPDTTPFEEAIKKQLGFLGDQSVRAIREIDPSLTAGEAMQVARLMPLGAATALAQLSKTSSSFAVTLLTMLVESRIGESFWVLKELCDPGQIHIGFRKNDESSDSPYLLWFIAPSPDGSYALLESAEDDSASLVFFTGGDYAVFTRQLNHSLEAVAFNSEVLCLSDEELCRPENTDYCMAVKRTAALQFVRSNYVGRLIHTNAEAWKRDLMEFFR